MLNPKKNYDSVYSSWEEEKKCGRLNFSFSCRFLSVFFCNSRHTLLCAGLDFSRMVFGVTQYANEKCLHPVRTNDRRRCTHNKSL